MPTSIMTSAAKRIAICVGDFMYVLASCFPNGRITLQRIVCNDVDLVARASACGFWLGGESAQAEARAT